MLNKSLNLYVKKFLLVGTFMRYRGLIWQLAKRDLHARYKGSYLGLFWSVLVPIFMLSIYTFVFGVIFKSRWGEVTTSSHGTEFALILFAGMTTYNLFSEILSRSPNLITENSNYVTKVIFPLEVLSLSVLGSALINASIGFGLIVIGDLIMTHSLPWTVIFLPIVLLPLILIALGLSWILSALGAYLRDLGHITMIILQALMYVTPIFYSPTSIPSKFQIFYYLNPIAHIVQNVRQVMIFGTIPGWKLLLFGNILGFFVSLIGYKLFQKARRGFADVI